jgi:hypothetical protein
LVPCLDPSELVHQPFVQFAKPIPFFELLYVLAKPFVPSPSLRWVVAMLSNRRLQLPVLALKVPEHFFQP